MSNEGTLKLSFDRDIHYQGSIYDRRVKCYSIGHHDVEQNLALLFLNLEGVRLAKTDKSYQLSESLEFLFQLYKKEGRNVCTYEELFAKDKVIQAMASKNIPHEVAKDAFSFIMIATTEGPLDSNPKKNSMLLDMLVTVACDTDPDYWIAKGDLLEAYQDRLNVLTEERNEYLIDVESEKFISVNSKYEDERFIEQIQYYETWRPYRGLALLCSLDPDTVFKNCSADMNIEEDIFVGQTYFDGNTMKCTGDNIFWLMKDFSKYTNNLITFSKVYLFPQDIHFVTSNPDAVKARANTLKIAVDNFKRLLKFWLTRSNTNQNLEVHEFISWTLSRGHKIEWLDEAIERGLVDPTKLKNYTKQDVVNKQKTKSDTYHEIGRAVSNQRSEFAKIGAESKQEIAKEIREAIRPFVTEKINNGATCRTEVTRSMYRHFGQSPGDGDTESFKLKLSSGTEIERAFGTIRKEVGKFFQ